MFNTFTLCQSVVSFTPQLLQLTPPPCQARASYWGASWSPSSRPQSPVRSGTLSVSHTYASKWSETSRNAKKFFSICEGGGGRVGGFASSEDQIGGNILSIFKFSRGKNQSCLKGAETSRNGIKRNSNFGWGWGGVKIQNLENSNSFFFLTPSLRNFFFTTHLIGKSQNMCN